MTVGVAALCQWRYPDGQHGPCVVVAADRMMTSGNTEYEPEKRKIGVFSQRALILVAGDLAVHSQLIAESTELIRNNGITRIRDMANLYGDRLRALKAKRGEALYLSPLDLDFERFIGQQSHMNPDVSWRLTEQLQSVEVDATAIIAGCDDQGRICMVDEDGVVTSHDEIGFAAIGIGYPQAKAQFMLNRFASWWPFAHASILAYSAKRAAETAPGVGTSLDLMFVTKDGMDIMPLDYIEVLRRSYDEYAERQRSFIHDAANELEAWVKGQKGSEVTSPPPETAS
jgi:20S proteasome alpha/beta subunit